MKKQYFFKCILVSALLTVFTGCKLDETVFSAIDTDQFYRTSQDAEAAITAVYGALGDLYGGPAPLMAADFSADQVYPRPVVGRNTYTLFTYDPAYSIQRSFGRDFESPVQIWQASYTGIERANWVIERVPSTVMDARRRDEILGEAYFLRAFFHFMLTKNFGDVVVKTKSSTTLDAALSAKSTRADVYKQIYDDLNQAIPKLPSYSANLVKGRASKETAQGFFAKAALYNEDWVTALQQAEAVINSGKHSLVPDVRDVYNVTREDAVRNENMFAFEAESTAPGRTSQIMGLYGPPGSNAPAYGRTTFGSIFVYPKFFASFNPADKRKQLLDTNYVNAQGLVVRQRSITPITPNGILVKKYQDPNSVAASHAVNIPLLRYADVLLIAAEAEARANGATGKAYGYINQIRIRAGLAELASGLGKEPFIEAVLQERSWEFFAEGDRWYDLTRTGKFLTVIPAATNDVFPTRTPQAKHRYFPIPQDEINANPKIEQNPAWR